MKSPETPGWKLRLRRAIRFVGNAYRRWQLATWLILAFSLPFVALPFCRPAASSEVWERIVSLSASGAVRSIVAGRGAGRAVLYAVVEGWGVFRSEDGGGDWLPANYLPRDRLGRIHVNALALSPSDPRIALAAIADQPVEDWPSVYKTTDGGRSWVARRGLPVADLEAIAMGAGGMAYACSGNRIYASTDEGDTWLEAGQRPTAGPVLAMAVDQASGDVYIGTESDGLWLSTDRGVTWQSALPGHAVRAIAVLQRGGIYAGTDDGLYVSADGGASWQPLAAPVLSGETALMAIDSSTGRLLVSLKAQPILASFDGGAHWWHPRRLPTDAHVTALAPDPTTAGRLYVGTDRGLWRCDLPDAGRQ